MTREQIRYMIGRFLSWRLPDDFAPDGGVTFKRWFNEHMRVKMQHEPTGTNLLNATQAEAMLQHMLEDMPGQLSYDDACRLSRVFGQFGDFYLPCDQRISAWLSQQVEAARARWVTGKEKGAEQRSTP